MSVVSSVISFFMFVHAQMYAPKFAPLPTIEATTLSPLKAMRVTTQNLPLATFPILTAKSYLVIDGKSGEILASARSSTPLPPASTTKMMTALVAKDLYAMDKVASIGGVVLRDGSIMGLVSGERISVQSLLTALLIQSANDAAEELAKLHPKGREGFIQAMNEKANELGMNDTTYKNPTGFFESGHVSTVQDLLILAREVMKDEELSRLVSQQKATVTSSDGKILHTLHTTNELIGKVEGIQGVKTGWTQEAGECLVTQVTRGDHTILTAVLNSSARFEESRLLIEWAYATTRPGTLSL